MTGATENLGIRAESLITSGSVANVAFGENGSIRCRVFTSANDVMSSIIDGLGKNKRVSQSIVDTFNQMMNDQNFTVIPWKDSVTPSERNELGKYVGELLVGAHALSGDLNCGYHVTEFAVPESSNFAGIDSFLITTDQKDDNGTIIK